MPFVQTNPIQMLDNKANALVVREKVGGVNYVEIDTLNGSEVTRIHPVGQGPVEFFGSSPEGITAYVSISGYKTSGSLAEARLGVGVHTDQILSIYNAAGYYMDAALEVAPDTNTVCTFGRAKVGYPGLSDYAGFAHYDHNTSTSYSLAQANNGRTFINAPTGTSITLRINNVEVARMDATGFGIGITPAQKFEIGSNDNSEKVSIYHSNSNLYISQSKGWAYLINTETDTTNVLAVQGNGAGRGQVYVYDANNNTHIRLYCQSSAGRLYTDGSSPGDLWFNHNAHANIKCFSLAAEGETRYVGITGYRTGGTADTMQFAVGIHVDRVGSIYGCANGYYFDNKIGIGVSTARAQLHVQTGESGAVNPSGNANEIVVESDGNAGITIFTPDNAEGAIYFGDSNDGDRGQIVYDHNSDIIKFRVNAAFAHFFTNIGYSINEVSPDSSLCVNIGSGTGEILSLKTDTTHAFTGLAEADTIFQIRETVNGTGGILLESFVGTGSYTSFEVNAYKEAADVSSPIIKLMGADRSGGGGQAIGNADELLSVYNYTTEIITVKGNGDFATTGKVAGDLVMPVSIPSNPVAGSMYYDNATPRLYIYDGAAWDYTGFTHGV